MFRRAWLAAAVAVFPLGALVAGACGGSDFIDAPDLSASDGSIDGRGSEANADGPAPDSDAAGTGGDAETDADAARFDADASSDSGTAPLLTSLGTADPFVVLSGATVTNSGIGTILLGDVGTTGPSITGLTGPPTQPSGKTEINNARAIQAVLDVGTAYTTLNGRACPPANDLTGLDLGGMTLAPGVYCFSSSAGQIAGTTLTFDAKGDPNAVWVIQVGTALTVMDNANAVIIGGPASLGCRIFWTTGTAVTLNGGVHFVGNLLASSEVSLLTNATVVPGRAFGQTAGVTLLTNTVSAAPCP